MSINRVTISGNLTRDPELRSTQSGTQVLGFSVAVNDRRKNHQTGEWEDHANFVDCTMFGKRAESVGRYLSKGSKVAVDGSLRYSSWEDKVTGQRRSRLDVVVDEIEFMSRDNDSASEASGSRGGTCVAYGSGNGRRAETVASQGHRADQRTPYADDDIPF